MTSAKRLKLAIPSDDDETPVGRLEELKQREAELLDLLATVKREKLQTLRARPLTIGIVGFGRFGQFIAKTFKEHGSVVVTSRTNYNQLAQAMGVEYISLSRLDEFFARQLDVVVLAVSITSFKETVESLVKPLSGLSKTPLIVDVLSVKEHPRQVLLETLPSDCDVLCTHPMFGPDSGKDGWTNLNFVFEKTRINKRVLDADVTVVDSPEHTEGMDRMERFLSIWEEEGCRMVEMSCKDHDAYAANSQFITHLMGRILGVQGLAQTPIDTSGFQSVLKLIDSTTADSFDLFYGLYKYNQNSGDTIQQLRSAMEDVVRRLKDAEAQESGNILSKL
jgi:arogenate dehydrogenase (NADP+), plant